MACDGGGRRFTDSTRGIVNQRPPIITRGSTGGTDTRTPLATVLKKIIIKKFPLTSGILPRWCYFVLNRMLCSYFLSLTAIPQNIAIYNNVTRGLFYQISYYSLFTIYFSFFIYNNKMFVAILFALLSYVP